MYDYLRDPDDIYKKSFSIVQAETDFSDISPDIETIITRIIHSCGMPEIMEDLDFHPDIAAACRKALLQKKPILCDCEMVRHGIIRRFLPDDVDVLCTLQDDTVPERAKSIGNTRSAAAVELWQDRLEGAIAVFGNAPTALFHLLELLEAGAPRPAAIIGFPVGFVGAAESKQALIDSNLGIPFITVKGRRGGSAMAAAALNGAASLLRKEA